MGASEVPSYRPLGERIVVRRVSGWDEWAVSGRLIVAEERPPLEVGRVEAVGAYRAKDGGKVEVGVKEGDLVLFDRYAGEDLGEDRVVLVPSEVLAVIVG
jgi:chaperonin GroES